MATLLYEELGLTATATVEEIKKAYRKKALQTHPDRLPPTATPEQKKESEERFRKVNHAYEVLTDPEKRKEYDAHGVWPPPQTSAPRASTSGPQFHFHFDSDPFTSGHHNSFHSFGFSDPFALFDSIFGEMLRPQRSASASTFGFGVDPFDDIDARFDRLERDMDSAFNTPFFSSGFPGLFGSPFGGGMNLLPGMSSTFNMRQGPSGRRSGSVGDSGQWVSESYMTQSINGVTQSVVTRRDAEGNEHVTVTLPDGRKTHTINGVEQSSGGSLPAPSRQRNTRRSITVSEPQSLPASPPQPRHQRNSSRRKIPVTEPQTRQAQHQYNPPATSYTGNQPYYTNNYTTPPDSYAQSFGAPAATRRSNESIHERHQPHGVRAAPTATTTAYTQDRDRGSRRSNTYPAQTSSYNAYDQSPPSPQPTPSIRSHRSSHHQNHLQTTHHKSRDPYHPNPSPYYLDDIDRDRQHSKHHHQHQGSRRK